MNGSAFQQVSSDAVWHVNYAMFVDRAWAEFRKAQRRGWFERMKAKVVGQCRHLLPLPRITEKFYAGIMAVPLDQIRGSEGRVGDFDIDFYPLKEHNGKRWVSIAVAMMADKPLPPVELFQVGDIYYVRDGHHRISAARILGLGHIDAEVTVAT